MLLHIAVASALLLVAGTGGASTPESNSGLDAYLPSSEEWVVEGEIQRADGEADLFAAIDGGAELYLRHGFRRALFAQIREGWRAPGAAYSLATHPVGLYYATFGATLAAFAALGRGRAWVPWLAIGLFAIGRMLLDGLRHDLSPVGLAAERALACVLLLVSVVGLWMWLTKPDAGADEDVSR